MTHYTLEQLDQAALRHNSRRSWSVNEPETYDYAIMNLIDGEDDAKFLMITEHMHDSKGTVLSGDPGDSRLITLKRMLSKYTNDGDKESECSELRDRIKMMKRC